MVKNEKCNGVFYSANDYSALRVRILEHVSQCKAKLAGTVHVLVDQLFRFLIGHKTIKMAGNSGDRLNFDDVRWTTLSKRRLNADD